MKVWASPWCPLGWMKTNNHYACASNPQVNDLPSKYQGIEMKTQFRMEPKVLATYALFSRNLFRIAKMKAFRSQQFMFRTN